MGTQWEDIPNPSTLPATALRATVTPSQQLSGSPEANCLAGMPRVGERQALSSWEIGRLQPRAYQHALGQDPIIRMTFPEQFGGAFVLPFTPARRDLWFAASEKQEIPVRD